MRGVLIAAGILAFASATTAGELPTPRSEESLIGYSWIVAPKLDLDQPPYKGSQWVIPRDIRLNLHSFQALQRINAYVPFSSIDRLPDADLPVVHIDTANVTGKRLIQEFIHQDPRYVPIIDGDWVVVMPTRAVADPDYPLNMVVDRVTVKDVNLERLASAIHVRLKQTTGRQVFFRLRSSAFGQRDVEHITLDLSSRTVRAILLEGAAQGNCTLEFSVSPKRGEQDISFEPVAFSPEWFVVSLPWLTPIPAPILAVLERRHREGLATPGWHP